MKSSFISSRRCSCHNHRGAYNLLKYTMLLFFSTAFLLFLLTYKKRSTHPQHIPSPSKETKNLPVSDRFPLVKDFERKEGKKFPNEEARSVGFHLKNTNYNVAKKSSKLIYLATKYFGEWNPKHYYFLQLGNTSFAHYACPINSCRVTNNPADLHKSDAVLFHLRDLEVYSIPPIRAAQQVWILYSMEPPWLEIRDMRRFSGVFNWTMSYRRDSDLLLSYGFVGERENPGKLNWPKLNEVFEKKENKALWYVSNCHTDSNREEYVMRLKKVYPVDIIGGCGIEGCRPAESKRCYAKQTRVYKFYLAFENAICRDYVSEKLYNSLAFNLIPVTFGGANYSSLVPPNSIINAMEFSSPEELGAFLWIVSENKTLFLSFFEWKSKYRSYLQPWMCDLCKRLHLPIIPKTAQNLETWWHEGGSCQKWTDNGFSRVKNYAFPKYHTHKLK